MGKKVTNVVSNASDDGIIKEGRGGGELVVSPVTADGAYVISVAVWTQWIWTLLDDRDFRKMRAWESTDECTPNDECI